MIYWILVFIYVLFGFLIINNSGIKRFIYYYCGILYVPATLAIIPQSMLMGHYFYVSMFIISMIRYGEFRIRNFLLCPFSKVLFVVFISYILIGVFDNRVFKPLAIYRGLYSFLGSYFPFFIGWFSLVEEDRKIINVGLVKGVHGNYASFFDYILPATLFMTFYGVITSFLHANPILDAVGLEDRFIMGDYGFRSFRVTSFCVSSSVYGLVCATLFLSSIAIIKNKSKLQYIALCFLFINIFLSATRAAIIPFIVGLIVLIILNKGIGGIIKYICLLLLLLPFLFLLLPTSITSYMFELVDSIIDVVSPSGSGGEKYGGSNLDARSMQISAAMGFLLEKPLFGHGFGYFTEVLSKGQSHSELLGMESYLCFIGVERGLINFFAECLFYISCLSFFIKRMSVNKVYAKVGVSLLAMFIPFLVYAWVGGCWFFFMPILGYLVKAIYINRNKMIKI